MITLGTQYILTLEACRPEFVASPETIITTVTRAAQQAGLCVVQSVEHHFEPYGLTLVLLLSQSHLIVHTWPEYNTLIVDVFVCVPDFDVQPFLEQMRQVSGAGKMKMDTITFEHSPAETADRENQ